MSIPEWIYIAMGAVIARILLNDTNTKGYHILDWLRFVFDISRIVVLWPLVLFVEKIEEWLKHEPQTATPVIGNKVIVENQTESLAIQVDDPVMAAGVNEAGGKL